MEQVKNEKDKVKKHLIRSKRSKLLGQHIFVLNDWTEGNYIQSLTLKKEIISCPKERLGFW